MSPFKVRYLSQLGVMNWFEHNTVYCYHKQQNDRIPQNRLIPHSGVVPYVIKSKECSMYDPWKYFEWISLKNMSYIEQGLYKLAWQSIPNSPILQWFSPSSEQSEQHKLEQLERLRSEDTPRHPVITHTIDQFVLNPKSILLTSSYRIPSQKKVKAEKIRKICEKFKF